MKLRLGTRGSRLALAQSGWVADRIRRLHPHVEVETVQIQTSGDRIVDVPLGPHLGQSFFTKEIETALLERRIDVAVHSCKDLATVTTPGLRLVAFPEREDSRDALVSREGTLHELPAGARVGTSSPRRKGFLSTARPDLLVQDQRGNVPTRLRAVEEGGVDAVILALAGLRRLDLDHLVTETLDPSVMLPAAAQGALAVQTREDDARVAEVCAPLDDAETRDAVTAERACLRGLEAGCQAPVGALARRDGTRLRLAAAVVTPDGVVRVEEQGSAAEAESIGAAAASSLLDRLGLTSLRQAGWAGVGPERSAAPRGRNQ